MTKRPGWSWVFAIVLVACATPPRPAADAADPPWLLRHTFPGWDGQPVEVLGAPGPRAVAAFLLFAMKLTGASRPEEVGEVLLQVPSFYRVDRMPPVNVAPITDVGRWRIGSQLDFVGWEGTDDELLLDAVGHWTQPPEGLLERLSLADFALAMNDVVWKWPRLPGSRTFLRPPKSPDFVGDVASRVLREKLDRGVPLERAWQDLSFQWSDDVYVLKLLPGGLLRVEWHPEMDARDWPPPPPWEGNY